MERNFEISEQLPTWEVSVGSGNEKHDDANYRNLLLFRSTLV
jgi:hypothetical protein